MAHNANPAVSPVPAHVLRVDYTNKSAQILDAAGKCVAIYSGVGGRAHAARRVAADGWHLSPGGGWAVTWPPDGREHPVHLSIPDIPGVTVTDYPLPLTLDADADDDAVRAALAGHFGPAATGPAVTVLGVTTLTMRHPTIHRASIGNPRVTACGTMSHGKPNLIAQVVAVTDTDSVFSVADVLTKAGIAPCGMCRRCWIKHLVPSHEACQWNVRTPMSPWPAAVMAPSPQPATTTSTETATPPSVEPGSVESATDTPPTTVTGSSLVLDATDDTTLATSVAALDSAMRHRLRRALRDVESGDNDAVILATICETLAREAPDDPAIGVVFTTMEFENGYYLTTSGEVLFADGTTDNIDFDEIEDELTDEHGCRGPNYTLTVDLRTGEMEGEDYANIHGKNGLHRHFGVEPPPTAAAS